MTDEIRGFIAFCVVGCIAAVHTHSPWWTIVCCMYGASAIHKLREAPKRPGPRIGPPARSS